MCTGKTSMWFNLYYPVIKIQSFTPDIDYLKCFGYAGVWRPATFWSLQMDKSACQVCGASLASFDMAKGPKWSTTSPSIALTCCRGLVPKCCNRYYIFQHCECCSAVNVRGCRTIVFMLHAQQKWEERYRWNWQFLFDFFEESPGLWLSIRHLQPRHHSLWTSQWTRSLQRHASYTGKQRCVNALNSLLCYILTVESNLMVNNKIGVIFILI